MAQLTPLQSLIASGTKLWLDSVDPQEVQTNRTLGASGATSNPIIIADLVKTGHFDDLLTQLIRDGLEDEELAWHVTDHLVKQCRKCFSRCGGPRTAMTATSVLNSTRCWKTARAACRSTSASALHRAGQEMEPRPQEPHDKNTGHAGGPDRPGRSGGRRHHDQCDADLLGRAVSHGPRGHLARRPPPAGRPDILQVGVQHLRQPARRVQAEKHVPSLSPTAQGQVGIVNAKRIWRMNQQFWADKHLPLKQEMIFASTGTKRPEDPPWKYVEAFAGSDIETNPPATNDKVQESGRTFTRRSTRCRRPRCWPRSTPRSSEEDGEDADGGGAQEVRRSPKGTAAPDRRQARVAANNRGPQVTKEPLSPRPPPHRGRWVRSQGRPFVIETFLLDAADLVLTDAEARGDHLAAKRATPTSWSWVSTRARNISMRRASGKSSSKLCCGIASSSCKQSGRTLRPAPLTVSVSQRPFLSDGFRHFPRFWVRDNRQVRRARRAAFLRSTATVVSPPSSASLLSKKRAIFLTTPIRSKRLSLRIEGEHARPLPCTDLRKTSADFRHALIHKRFHHME